MKCLSTSITLHLEHSLLLRGVLGLVYLPRSISRGWELDRIFVIAFRYLESFIKSRYVSKWKPFLMFLYNSNLGNLLKFCILDHQCSTKKLFCLFLTSLMTTVGSSMSKLYFSAISLTLLTQVRKPWLWRLYSVITTLCVLLPLITLRQRQNDRQFADDILKSISLNESCTLI